MLLDDVYYNPSIDNSDYYLSNPDASKIEEAERETGVDMEHPLASAWDALKGLFN